MLIISQLHTTQDEVHSQLAKELAIELAASRIQLAEEIEVCVPYLQLGPIILCKYLLTLYNPSALYQKSRSLYTWYLLILVFMILTVIDRHIHQWVSHTCCQ